MPKHLLITIVCLMMSSSLCRAGIKDDEVNRFFTNLTEAFNSRNLDKIAESFLSDGELVTLAGGILKGSESIKEAFSEAFAGPYKSAKYQYLIQNIRFKDDVAVVDGIWKISNGPANYPACGIFLQNLIKENGAWKTEMFYSSVPKTGHTSETGRTLSWTKICKE